MLGKKKKINTISFRGLYILLNIRNLMINSQELLLTCSAVALCSVGPPVIVDS